MKKIFCIAAAQWLYWLRSYLALSGALIFLILIVATSIFTGVHVDAQSHERNHQQAEAEETFLTQPDRHPHRMVHYGHYVFRAPAPLAIFDPGLDSVTGQSIFLEGHRQNTAMFAQSQASADFGGLSWLSPALIYQIFAPLMIILLGHGAIVREREMSVLSSLLSLGIKGNTLLFGKAFALLGFIFLLLTPLFINCVIAMTSGENLTAVLLLYGVYLIYLVLWGMVSLCISSVLRKHSAALAVLTGLWFVFTLVLPSVAVNLATNAKALPGKIEMDLAMLADIRKLGDGHNANDPAFQQLRAQLLKKYDADRIEDLPVNFRGMVAIEGERKLTGVLNDYAKSRMNGESQQEKHLTNYGWLTPALAIADVSRAIAGTDLAHYHRFLKEAEVLRFSFVQGLNRAHVDQLSYQDDINRNKDLESGLRARVDASNWQVLNSYQFRTAPLTERIRVAFDSIQILLTWLIAMLSVMFLCGRRIKP